MGYGISSPPWNDPNPVRQELFGVERLESHAKSLAAAQQVTLKPQRVTSLHARLDDNDKTLLAAYRGSIIELENGRAVVPAAEWLLDNYHLVEDQIREIRDDLPLGYYRQLPKLASGPFAGYPRVFGLVWAYVAHTDSHFDVDMLCRFITAYQSIQPLTIGELWAVAITLRIVLIENLRRLADQISLARIDRQDANHLTDKLLQDGNAKSALDADIVARATGPLSEHFAAQLAKRLRDQDPRTMPALEWLEQRLQQQSLSVTEVVQHAHQRQGASNVSIRNIILSLRLISDIDWADVFESVSLVDQCLCGRSAFASMDFATRNLYRSAIEQLAKRSPCSELQVAEHVLRKANSHRDAMDAPDKSETNAEPPNKGDVTDKESLSDPGFYLIDAGRTELEKLIAFQPSIGQYCNRLQIRLGIAGYMGSILLLVSLLLLGTLKLLGFSLISLPALQVFIVGFLPATEIATALVNRMLSWRLGAHILPGLELTHGVPSHLRTLIAVPVLLENDNDVIAQVERLEVHYLSGIEGDVSFVLLSDGVDANSENISTDTHRINLAANAIDLLNQRYGEAPAGPRFILLHRRRQFNASEKKWMGWERKRGKLHELNRLLRGATDTSFVPVNGRPVMVPEAVRYVIVLDADTRLPRESALKLIGKMAHPLNRAQLSTRWQRVVRGYGILQPRVTPSLSTGAEGSLYQRIFSSPGGIDPYSAAVSDVYQDLFGEGSFTGKGIYDVDAFTFALAGRVNENTMLSHDLYEGIFARAGLVSDVDVVEEFPARYDVVANRQHRWTRGDWQLLPWILGRSTNTHAVTTLGRCKMLDNLRRSLVPPAMFTALILCWLWPLPAALTATALILSGLIVPAFLPSLFAMMPRHAGVNIPHHLRMLTADLRMASLQCILQLAFLPDQTWRMADAIVHTLWRMTVSKHYLLQWKTAAQLTSSPRLSVSGFYSNMKLSTTFVTATTVLVAAVNIEVWPLLLPFMLLWLFAPILALWTSRPPRIQSGQKFDADNTQLRLIARKTWRYFETFVTPADNMLPPDNFQDNPESVIAHRTSPTNMGLYLLAAVAARDFGWAGTLHTLKNIEATLDSMTALAKFKGHFFNWYQTETAAVMPPEYISSVDSGNLAGHLITLANACEEWRTEPVSKHARAGIIDSIKLADEAMQEEGISREHLQGLQAMFADVEAQVLGVQTLDTLAPSLLHSVEKIRMEAVAVLPNTEQSRSADLLFWIDSLHTVIAQHQHDESISDSTQQQNFLIQIDAVAHRARAMALAMDFSFLLDPERKLLAIGYSVDENSLDKSCYDLLASEARLASLVAIAKGDIRTKHWFRLGRTATPIGTGSALISWSGSMFEYLMPSLVMRGPAGSLLEQTNHLIVERQMTYARQRGIPWGISESAYNARDIELTYQYLNFGVPGLGLKRGLADDLVVAPYATALATMVDAEAAKQNFNLLARLGSYGRFGFYDALDFTRSRLPKTLGSIVVKNFMAHHQGMSIVAIANTLHQGNMRERFHREPMIQACELLLHERIPRDVAISHPRAEEAQAARNTAHSEPVTVRRLSPRAPGAPNTHLLSNGRYSVMLTAAGSGYSRWKDIAVTRWREDSTRDNYGAYIFLRDINNGHVWSATAQPLGNNVHHQSGVFGEDYAEFVHHQEDLVTTLEVIVSGEDDGEVRRISISNTGRNNREIELTSYAEVVLTTAATDNAHPAFAKMFVQTEFIAELGALVASRRPRSSEETPIWAAHFAIVEGEISANPQYESDRMQFIGRGNSLDNAAAMQQPGTLSQTVGTVLDPIFSVRQRITIDSGNVARVAFWTLVATSREALLDLIDRHHDRSAFDRAKTLAWTQAQVQLRHLAVSTAEAAEFQRLAAPILYANPRFRASSAAIIRGAGRQSALWSLAISGDLPIVLLRIDDNEDIAQVKQLLRAHEYWRSKYLAVDLVIINEHPSSYLQDLQNTIETAIRSSQSRPRLHDELALGSVFALRADLLACEHREQLVSIARVVLTARHGTLDKQFKRLPKLPSEVTSHSVLKPFKPVTIHTNSADQQHALEFFNGLGGFADNGREYVILLNNNESTPAPWINVIANPNFGFNVAAEGSGYTWAENSRENQLTAWSNDPVCAPVTDAIYIQDTDRNQTYTATALPLRDAGTYTARHGFGYSHFEHSVDHLTLELTQFVPLQDPIKISRLVIRNHAKTSRNLVVTAYTEWVLGRDKGACAPFVITERDKRTGALFASNPWDNSFPGRIAFADLNAKQQTWTADRREFLGRNGNTATPIALHNNAALRACAGAGLDPCAVLQYPIVLAPGEHVEVVAFLGQGKDVTNARDLIERYRSSNLDQVFNDVKLHWTALLGSVQVTTPERSMDIMLNGWLLYQTLACRIWARSAFYQASGAYGFRDQLQDGMALTFAKPQLTRSHLLRAASRQFITGDVQHWWLPHSGQGVRTHISDDRAWLALATATYIQRTGDVGILDETISFLDGPELNATTHDAYFLPVITDESATLFEHCARALQHSLTLIGANGLPLMGTGDWNDGMNQVGSAGRGESVWLAWLMVRAIRLFAPLAQTRGKIERQHAARWLTQADAITQATEHCAWDGQWYRRATFDNGSWLGTATNHECKIDSIAQTWAVISGAANPQRAKQAMDSVGKYLIRPDQGLALLFTPPFDTSKPSPGYIQGYPPGLRENGGQYSHAAMWAILALAKQNLGDQASELFNRVNPINHSNTQTAMARYKVEPYVVAADVYSVAPHVGRGGWTWYTGAAGWLYQAGLEGILGISRQGQYLRVSPTIPRHWPGFTTDLTLDNSRFHIEIIQKIASKAHTESNQSQPSSPHKQTITRALLDDNAVVITAGALFLALDGSTHNLVVYLT